MSTDTLERPDAKERKAEPEKVRRLSLNAFQPAEFAYAEYAVTLPVGWPLEAALEPEFWANCAHVLGRDPVAGSADKSGTIIKIRTQDHAFYAELYVRAVLEKALVVTIINGPVQLSPKEDGNAIYKARWNVGARGFDIIRASDQAIVGQAKDFKTKEHALAYIGDVLKG